MKVQTLKGFRDFLPKEARKRQYVLETLRKVFESYGFEPLETPALEYEEILTGKYGDEGEKLMYKFKDLGGRDVAMRYDQTVPLARVVAQYGDKLPMPFKRYQIQNVWRAENTQKGRFREFLQVDIDIVGSNSTMSDAEVIGLAIVALQELGLKNFITKVNFKDSLIKKLQKIQVEDLRKTTIEMDKKGKKEPPLVFKDLLDVRNSLATTAVVSGTVPTLNDLTSLETSEKVFNYLEGTEYAKPLGAISDELSEAAKKPEFKEYFSEPQRFEEISSICRKMGAIYSPIVYEPNLVRGLDYYTGVIFEIELPSYKPGSIAGGGRYDKLIGLFSNKQIPAVGFSFGFDRLLEAMDELNLFPESLTDSASKVLITIFRPEFREDSLKLASKLRNEGVNAEVYLDENANLEKQLKYADKKGIPFVAVFGPKEKEDGKITLKDMKKRKEKKISEEELLKSLSF